MRRERSEEEGGCGVPKDRATIKSLGGKSGNRSERLNPPDLPLRRIREGVTLRLPVKLSVRFVHTGLTASTDHRFAHDAKAEERPRCGDEPRELGAHFDRWIIYVSDPETGDGHSRGR